MRSRRRFLAVVAGAPLAFSQTSEPLSSLERRVFAAINFQRAAHGCLPLQWDDALARTSREHSERMVAASFFGHEDPLRGNLADRLNAAGFEWVRCAENVFREQHYPDPVSIAVISWMYSDGHRDNLLTPVFQLTGVGVARGPDEAVVVTQQFVLLPKGRRLVH